MQHPTAHENKSRSVTKRVHRRRSEISHSGLHSVVRAEPPCPPRRDAPLRSPVCSLVGVLSPQTRSKLLARLLLQTPRGFGGRSCLPLLAGTIWQRCWMPRSQPRHRRTAHIWQASNALRTADSEKLLQLNWALCAKKTQGNRAEEQIHIKTWLFAAAGL